MNLVAKEYVAAQEPDDPGVLVLSRFAGAAHELRAAILVNPYDTQAVAAAIARALAMPREERIARFEDMIVRLRQHGVREWCQLFLRTLMEAPRMAPVRPDTTAEARRSARPAPLAG